MDCILRIHGPLLKGIKNLAFSPDGKFLAASAMDDDHTIAIYDW
jgi:WD40 repeat protein